MIAWRTIWTIAWLALVSPAGELLAADIASVHRNIGKQPMYSGQPLYALAVFGAEAKTRMWIVVDKSSAQDDVLYLDLNGDDNLVDPAEQIDAEFDARSGRFSLPVLVDPSGTKHTDFSLRLSSGSRPAHMLSLKWRGKHKIGGGYPVDPSNGYMQFAKSPQDAPIIWFNGDGPFRFQPWYNDSLRIGSSTDLKLFIGQQGVGKNSFCAFQKHVLPDGDGVVATLVYTDKNGAQQETTSYLDRRC